MHVRQRPNGTWEAIVQHAGERRKVVAKTRTDAQVRGVQLLVEMGAPAPTTATVAELLAAWLTNTTLSATYRADAERITQRLPAAFTGRQVAEVTPLVIDHLYRQLDRDGWTAHRIRRAHQVMSSAWTLANRWEMTDRHPWRKVRPPAPPRRHDTTPSPQQVGRLLARLDDRMWLFVALAAVTGARRGELVGLQWPDLRGESVSISRSIAYTPAAGVVVTDGKTGAKGHRAVAIDADLAGMLKEHRARQVTGAVAAGLGQPVWVFSHDHGRTPWRPDWATHQFGKVRAAAGITDVRLHDLRHYVATQLLAAGVPLKVVGERLGHTQLSTTSDRYGAFVPAADRQAAEVMARLRRGSGRG